MPPTQPCPECTEDQPADPRWHRWCDACGWNLTNRRPERQGGVVLRWRRGQARREGERLFAELQRGDGARSHRVRRVLAPLVAAAVLLSVPALVALLVECWLLGGFTRWAGAFLCGTALWVCVPRPHRLDRDAVRLSRADAPQLWRLVDVVAAEAGQRPPRLLAVDTELNACATRVGPRYRTAVVIGLPLWQLLEPQERVALLGHELAHHRHGDTAHLAFVSSAQLVLLRWVVVLWPDAVDRDPMPDVAALALLGRFLRRVLALLPLALLRLLDALTAVEGLRAEYRADVASAAVAGSTSARSALLRLMTLDGVWTAMSSAARRREDLWRHLAASVPPPERELRRLELESAHVGHQVDASHPPTHLRAGLLSARDHRDAAVVLDEAWQEALDVELAPARAVLATRLVDDLLE